MLSLYFTGKIGAFYLPTFFEPRLKAPETPALYVHKCRLSEHRVVFRAFPCQFLCPFSSPHLTGLYKQLYYPLFPWLAGRDLNCAQGRPRHIQRLRRHTVEIAKIYLHFPLLRSVSKENMYPADRPKHILFLIKKPALCGVYRLARPITGVLVHTCERVKYRAFSDVRIAGKCYYFLLGIFCFFKISPYLRSICSASDFRIAMYAPRIM